MNSNRKPSSISRQAGSGRSQSSISRQANNSFRNGPTVGNNHVACGPWGTLGGIEHFIHIEAHIPDPNRQRFPGSNMG